jgi:methyl-accepting chemotaxis protein
MRYLYSRPWLAYIALVAFVGISSAIFSGIFSLSFLSVFIAGVCFSGLTFWVFQWYVVKPINNYLVMLSETHFQDEENVEVDLSLLDGIVESLNALSGKTRGVSNTCSQVAIAGAEVSYASDVLTSRVKEQLKKVEKLSETSAQVTQNIETAAQESNHLSELSTLTSEASRQGQEAINSANQDMQRTDEQVKSVSNLITDLNDQISQIFNITHEINGIADQTNLLALNASIEAARAGEHGRGFAVVADEVRSLATRTSSSTSEISGMVQGINRGTSQLSKAMEALVAVVSDTMGKTEQVNVFLDNINSQAKKVDAQVLASKERAEQNRTHQAIIASEFDNLALELNATQTDVKEVSEHSTSLSRRAENIYELLGETALYAEHKVVLDKTQAAVAEIEAVFEASIEDNTITMDDLFDRNYVPIESTNPTKFSTRFDTFTDRVLPAIQEPMLSESFIIFAGAVDNNGYFPTHNNRYSQPLSGDYNKDLVNNRTKRIFDDPTGIRCGSHEKPFLIQTYKRDTGEIVHDLSIPIYVCGKRWGGFRVGYTSKAQE